MNIVSDQLMEELHGVVYCLAEHDNGNVSELQDLLCRVEELLSNA